MRTNVSNIKSVGQEGSERYLLSLGNDQASILYLKEKVLSAPMHIESFYSHGFWQDYQGNLDLNDLLPLLQVEVTLGGPLMPFIELFDSDEEAKCVVFRQNDADRKLLYPEILQGRLRQGWGFSDRFSLFQGQQSFIQSYQNGKTDLAGTAQKHWNVLSRILSIKEGDTIVIPKQPDSQHFLIVKAKRAPNSHSCYEFSQPLEPTNDYRHVVHIDPDHIQKVHYDSPLTPLIVKRLLKSIAYSSPVNMVRNQEFKQAIGEVFSSTEKEDLEKAHPLHDKLLTIENKLYTEWVKTVRNLTPSDFEKLVKKCMKDNGFTILKSNSYDRKGGDIDLLCSMDIPVETPFEPKSINLTYCIQIKKHENLTGSTGVHQLVSMEKNLNLDEAHVVQKILISLADGFTEECEEMAADNRVELINGVDFAQIYFKSI
ncbi:restriction endonuclease [Neobacillus drentensis]|uniref:restriction endonuclease n=1 Tax=Neobacillus drentensis TaxID=220684 RepID=UPI002FFDD32E